MCSSRDISGAVFHPFLTDEHGHSPPDLVRMKLFLDLALCTFEGVTMKSRLSSFAVVVFLLFLPASTPAQDAAQITGTVTDPTGAFIPNAPAQVR
jgi:hypothetical protein